MYEQIMSIISNFNEDGESISEFKLRELTALLQPLLFDHSDEFQKHFDTINKHIKVKDNASKIVLENMLRYFATNKETLVQTTDNKLFSIYSTLFCIPIIFKNNEKTTEDMTIDITSFVPQSFYDNHNLIIFHSLLTKDMNQLDARELAKAHQYITQLHGDKFDYMYDALMKYAYAPAIDQECSLGFILGAISSDQMIKPDVALLEPMMMANLQTMIKDYIEVTYDSASIVMPMTSFDEGIQAGINMYKSVIADIAISQAYNMLDNPDSITVKIRYSIEEKQMIAWGLKNDFPLFTIKSEIFDANLSIAENIELLEKMFRNHRFKLFV